MVKAKTSKQKQPETHTYIFQKSTTSAIARSLKTMSKAGINNVDEQLIFCQIMEMVEAYGSCSIPDLIGTHEEAGASVYTAYRQLFAFFSTGTHPKTVRASIKPLIKFSHTVKLGPKGPPAKAYTTTAHGKRLWESLNKR